MLRLHPRRSPAVVLLTALLAVGCAGHSSSDLLTAPAPTPTAEAFTAAAPVDEPDTPADPSSTTVADVVDSAASGASTQSDQATENAAAGAPLAELEPVSGGSLVYAVEADTLNAWRPQSAAAAISGHMVMRSVYDLLAYPDADGVVRGVLLSGFAPNDDATVWTLQVREGIRFHDGTPLDGPAVADNLVRHQGSILTGTILADLVDAVAVDDMTVEVSWNRPMPHFPALMTTLIGYVASPTWLAAVDAGDASAAEPVGTGPFVFAEYVPGASFRATRNADYWQEGLPHLDEITFVVENNTSQRTRLLRDQEASIVHTDRGDEVLRFREQLGTYGLIETAQFGETRYLMLNQADPESEVADVRVRRAMAAAIDLDLYRAARAGNLFELANGPFPPGTMGHLEETGAPTHDPDLASSLIAEVEAERGPVEIEWKVTADEFNLISAELIAAMWTAAGIDVEIVSVPQDQAIFQALTANFEVMLWRNHGGFDPDLQYHWWHSSTAVAPPGLSVNFSRLSDPVIDENLDIIRSSTDAAERRAAAEAVNRRFGEQVYNIWLTWPVWAIAHDAAVHDVVEGVTLPDGETALPTGVGIGGTHLLAQLWMEER